MSDLATVAAGVAVIIGVVALLTSAEVSKRLQSLVDQKLADADVKITVALQQQDQRITTLRKIMSQNAACYAAGVRPAAPYPARLPKTAPDVSPDPPG